MAAYCFLSCGDLSSWPPRSKRRTISSGFKNFSFHLELRAKMEQDHIDFCHAVGECDRVGGSSMTGREAESMDPKYVGSKAERGANS